MKKILSLVVSLAFVFAICFTFVACGNNGYSGKTYKLAEVIMLNNNGSEDTYEEYLAATGITEKQIIDIKNYYDIEIKDSSTIKAFLMKYITGSIKFVDDKNVIFVYGFSTIQDKKLNRSIEYEYEGVYSLADSNLSINLYNYEYKKSGEKEETDEGLYKGTLGNVLAGTMYGDLSYNIVTENNTIKMNLYKVQEDGSHINNISLIFKKV